MVCARSFLSPFLWLLNVSRGKWLTISTATVPFFRGMMRSWQSWFFPSWRVFGWLVLSSRTYFCHPVPLVVSLFSAITSPSEVTSYTSHFFFLQSMCLTCMEKS